MCDFYEQLHLHFSGFIWYNRVYFYNLGDYELGRLLAYNLTEIGEYLKFLLIREGD